MTIQTVRYPYEPSPEDLANFEAIWLELWHPRFRGVAVVEYMQIKQLVFEAFMVGFNQHRADIEISLERSLHNDS